MKIAESVNRLGTETAFKVLAEAKKLGIHANPNNSATEAIAQLAIQDPNAIIVVCGSLYSAGKVLEQNI